MPEPVKKQEKNATPAAIETPCDGNCVIDPETGWCEGCFRTMREIARWTAWSPEKRRRVMDELPLRRKGLVEPEDDDWP